MPGVSVRSYFFICRLAMDLIEIGEDVGLRLLSRIVMTPHDDSSIDAQTKKRKKNRHRPTTSKAL